MARYLITGGAGFIGSHLARALVGRGEAVRVLDDFSTGRRENLESISGRVEILEGSVEDAPLVARGMQGVDFVLHQAALPSVQRSVESPLESHATNLTGTLVLLEAARRLKVRKFVYASSSSVYGDTPRLPKVETMIPDPLSPYAIGKLGGELYCRVYHRLHGLETISLRYFNIFGPGQRPDSAYAAVIPRFLDFLSRGEAPLIFGDGRQSRDFTFVDNVVQANLAACVAPPEAAGEAYNVACGERFSLLELLNEIGRLTGARIPPRFEPARAGDVRDSQASIEKARSRLGYRPSISFAEGLRLTLVSAGMAGPVP